MVTYIFLGVIILMCISSIRFNSNNSILDRNTTNFIKGISILTIVLHHMLNRYSPNNYIMNGINVYAGYLLTGVFFMLSGFGNYFSIHKYKKNLNSAQNNFYCKWILSKLFNILIVFLIIYLITYIGMIIFDYGYFDIKKFFLGILTLKLPTCSTWFLKVLIVCYLLEYIFLTYLKDWYAIIAMIIVHAVYCYVCFYMSIPNKWYSSVGAFIVGVIIAQIYSSKKLNKKIKISYVRKLLISTLFIIILLVLFVLMTNIESKYISYGYNIYLSTSIFSAFVAACTVPFIFRNKMIEIIGNYTLEIYLAHLGWIYIIENMQISRDIKNLFLILITIASVWITIVIKKFLYKIRLSDYNKFNTEK